MLLANAALNMHTWHTHPPRPCNACRSTPAGAPLQLATPNLTPCIFEYIYLSRPDSVINNIPVYEFQLALGSRLSKRIKWVPLCVSTRACAPAATVMRLSMRWTCEARPARLLSLTSHR